MFRKSLKKGKKVIEFDNEDDYIEIQKMPVKRSRGIPANQILETIDKQEDPSNSLAKKFVKSKSEITKIRENHLENYIKDTLNLINPSPKQIEEKLSEDILYKIPDKYKTDNSRITEGSEKTLWLTGLVEVPLSLEHKLDNIEATEAAKRRAIKDSSGFTSRFNSLHTEEYEQFNETINQEKNNRKTIERLEKKMILRGKKYKIDKEERIKNNQKVEKSWQKDLNSTNN
jgi:Hepatocellular carcinoma-associated antigen 59